jgi:hypothetical protein
VSTVSPPLTRVVLTTKNHAKVRKSTIVDPRQGTIFVNILRSSVISAAVLYSFSLSTCPFKFSTLCSVFWDADHWGITHWGAKSWSKKQNWAYSASFCSSLKFAVLCNFLISYILSSISVMGLLVCCGIWIRFSTTFSLLLFQVYQEESLLFWPILMNF